MRLTDYSESSQIAWLFTHKHGLVRMIAKGTKRSTRGKAAVGLDLLERGELTFLPAKGDASLGTLTDWRQLDAHRACRESLGSLYAALYAVELVTAYAEDSDPAPRLWELLAELLAMLGPSSSIVDAVAGFQLNALREFGVLPELRECVDCGHVPADLTRCYMSATAGGLLCRDCESSHVEKQAVPAKLLSEEVLQEHPGGWFGLLDYYITESLNKPLRSAGMLKMTLRAAGR